MADVVDISFINYFAPILAFLLVTIVIAAILIKTKLLGDNKWVQVFVALFIASIFVSVAGARQYVLNIVPWVAVLIVALLLVFLIVGFVGKPLADMHKGIGVVFLILFGIVFVVAGFFVFSEVLVKYIPGPSYGVGASPEGLYFTNWLYSPRVMGAIVLVVLSAIVAWVLVKEK